MLHSNNNSLHVNSNDSIYTITPVYNNNIVHLYSNNNSVHLYSNNNSVHLYINNNIVHIYINNNIVHLYSNDNRVHLHSKINNVFLHSKINNVFLHSTTILYTYIHYTATAIVYTSTTTGKVNKNTIHLQHQQKRVHFHS